MTDMTFDLGSTDLNINRDYLPTKFQVAGVKHS